MGGTERPPRLWPFMARLRMFYGSLWEPFQGGKHTTFS